MHLAFTDSPSRKANPFHISGVFLLHLYAAIYYSKWQKPGITIKPKKNQGKLLFSVHFASFQYHIYDNLRQKGTSPAVARQEGYVPGCRGFSGGVWRPASAPWSHLWVLLGSFWVPWPLSWLWAGEGPPGGEGRYLPAIGLSPPAVATRRYR